MGKRLIIALFCICILLMACNSKQTGTELTQQDKKDRITAEETESAKETRTKLLWPDKKDETTTRETESTGETIGTIKYDSGDRYEGEIKNGKKEGTGIYYWSGGGRYEGEFKADKIEGTGICYYSGGDRYEGEFKAGKKEGYGTYYWSDGRRYEGEWKNDKQEGTGIFFNADGSHYEGEWKAGKRVVTETGTNSQKETVTEREEPVTKMGKNMLMATVNGENMTFYLQKANSASDGYESNYISFTAKGTPRYMMYLRIPVGAEAGSYSNANGKACYFSISTRYDQDTEKWADSYRMVHYGSKTEDIGSYRLTIDHDLSWDNKEGSGTFEAEMVGCSTSTKGKTIHITNGSFHYTWGEVHSVVQAWSSGSSTEIWMDPYDDSETKAQSRCPVCKGDGRRICISCDGLGYLEQVKYALGGKSYTVKVDCACDNGYYKCWRCGGNGVVD